MTLEWSQICPDGEILIVEKLDYDSRSSLRICSNDDNITKKLKKFTLSEQKSPMDTEKTTLRIDIDNLTIWFIEKGNVTKVDRALNGELKPEWSELKQEKRYDVARRFLDDYCKKFGEISADSIEIKNTPFLPSENWKLKCDSLTLSTLTLTSSYTVTPYQKWLSITETPLKNLKILKKYSFGTSFPITPEIIKISERLEIEEYSDMNDAQLNELKATHIRVESQNITWKGIKTKIESILKEGNLNAELEVTFKNEDFDCKQLIPANMKFTSSKDGDWPLLRAKITSAPGKQWLLEIYKYYKLHVIVRKWSLGQDDSKTWPLYPDLRVLTKRRREVEAWMSHLPDSEDEE